MEIEMHSPPRLASRSTSCAALKRPRSPPSSPTSYERPTKRLSFGGSASPVSLPLTNNPRYNAAFDVLQHPLGIASDDWVTRTRTLCIDRDSPTVEQVFKLTSVDEYGEGMDETMTVDGDEPPLQPCPPPNSPMQFSTDYVPSPYLPSENPFSYPNLQHLLPSSSSEPSPVFHASTHVLSTPSLAEPGVPLLQEQDTFVPGPFNSTASESAAHANSKSEHDVSLSSTFVHTRRQRFTMGPRSDCEKCRLGVPGHWMHFD
ncbi:hypothetical protein PHLCEN_2v3013 [Hermanssonia centrifuga]|uniref:Uncharacterized protein n=1 Tax=Hermanssonia centrifuga TaxID=98765 RepID=A0A2R6R7D0_9APHY|nr:hypothetical protein PHLCEN_2v3013 [Hermanssonia centrifuga]